VHLKDQLLWICFLASIFHLMISLGHYVLLHSNLIWYDLSMTLNFVPLLAFLLVCFIAILLRSKHADLYSNVFDIYFFCCLRSICCNILLLIIKIRKYLLRYFRVDYIFLGIQHHPFGASAYMFILLLGMFIYFIV
jgi:hypothetical protein